MTANNNSQKNISSIFTSFLSIAILHLGILSFIFLQQDYNPLKELQKFVDFLYRMEIVVLFVLLLLTTYYFFIYLYKNTFSTSSKRLLYFLYVSSILPLSLSLLLTIEFPHFFRIELLYFIYYLFLPLFFVFLLLLVFLIGIYYRLEKQIKLFPFNKLIL